MKAMHDSTKRVAWLYALLLCTLLISIRAATGADLPGIDTPLRTGQESPEDSAVPVLTSRRAICDTGRRVF